MALHRAIFEVTCDSNGEGSDDVTLKLPSTLARHAQLVAVTVDLTEALGYVPTVTLSELLNVEDEDWNDSDETLALGRQLFFVDMGLDAQVAQAQHDEGVYEFKPRMVVSTTEGAAPSVDAPVGAEIIRRKKARCEVYSAVASDVVTVNMYYETAGDYRF